MSKRVALILSGCGVYDGTEIHESVLALLRLSQCDAEVQCFAPDIDQLHVINHLNGEVSGERRNVLVESARIARGAVRDLRELDASQLDALIIPGGFGAAKNLSDFASAGADCQIQPDLLKACRAFVAAGKPVGLICIAPALTGKLIGAGARCTIGNDPETARAVEQMGALHVDCGSDGLVIDPQHKLVSTPAYMLAGSIAEAAVGISKLVDAVLEMA